MGPGPFSRGMWPTTSSDGGSHLCSEVKSWSFEREAPEDLGVGCRVEGVGFRVWGVGLRMCRVRGVGCRVWGVGCRV